MFVGHPQEQLEMSDLVRAEVEDRVAGEDEAFVG
jgi:hypothetical protein